MDEPSVESLLGKLQAYLAGEESFDEYARFSDEMRQRMEELYPADDDMDMSNNLRWSYVFGSYGVCLRARQERLGEDYVHSSLRPWVPHLVRGEDAWRASVDAGLSPLQVDDDDDG